MRRLTFALCTVVVAACGGDTKDSASLDAARSIDAQTAAARTDLSFTSDVMLTGYLSTSDLSPPGSPGVVLVHQYTNNDEQWGTWPETLAAKGYRVLAFNLRGHGDSAPYDGVLSGILGDPEAAPADLQAAVTYLTTEGQANPERIAIIGTSIGANLSVAAAAEDLAKTYVSLSSRKSAVEIFAGKAITDLDSVFYLAGENDSGGVQAADAQTLFDSTTEPRELKVYSATSDHGIAILNNQADSFALIEDWLAATL